MRHERLGERGAAILVLVALLGVAVMITSVGLGIARIAAARVQASSAADLAALAAAPNLDCARARAVAVMNRAQLVDCEVLDRDVEVTVGLRVPLAGRQVQITAESRAGPP